MFFVYSIRKFLAMKKREREIIIAGSIGFLAVLGFFVFRKFFNEHVHDTDYDDYHQNFTQDDPEDHHGIEFLAMK